MRKITLVLVFLITCFFSFSQTQTYFTSGGETIFSFAEIEYDGNEESSIIRFAPYFNVQSLLNVDMGEHFGFITGLGIRNVGFIFEDYVDPVSTNKYKKKFRTYSAGLPFGLKIGNLDKVFIYGGYEFEFPFNYKEKTFEGDKKIDKFNVWFSDRVEQVQQSFFVGIQLPYETSLKFKYYLTNFHNKDFIATVDGQEYKPYEILDANVFYFSLSFDLFQNPDSNSSGVQQPGSYTKTTY